MINDQVEKHTAILNHFVRKNSKIGSVEAILQQEEAGFGDISLLTSCKGATRTNLGCFYPESRYFKRFSVFNDI
jgi:hypothetical protein